MPPWNAAGTRVSKAPVIAAGNVSVSCPAAPLTSRADRARLDQRNSRLAQHPRQNGSSPSRARILRLAASRCAQRRNDVPRGGSAAPAPRAIAPQAAARSAPGCATTPRPPQDDGCEQQPPGLFRAGIEPHRLHHHSARRSKPRSAACASCSMQARRASSSRLQTSTRRTQFTPGPDRQAEPQGRRRHHAQKQ